MTDKPDKPYSPTCSGVSWTHWRENTWQPNSIRPRSGIDPDAEVIMFKGVGLDDEIINTLIDRMVDGTTWEDGSPDEKLSLMHTEWPTRFQYKILREAMDMCRHGDFHEESLASRLHGPVGEIHKHLELLTDLGLMEAAE